MKLTAKLLLSLLTLLPAFLFSQNYQTLSPIRNACFQTEVYNMHYYGEYINFYEDLDGLIGIRIDSISPDSQTLFFPVYARGHEYGGGICPGDSWLGPKVDLLPDGKNLFYNGMGDTIVFETAATLGTSWPFMVLGNGNYFQAHVTGIYNWAVLGVTDTVKTISLQLKNESGSNLPHEMNGFEIRIGKESGLVNIPDLFHFPNDASEKSLVGLTNPEIGVQLLNSRRIYNYQVGQERHTYKECSNSNDYSHSRTSVREIVLEKDSSLNEVSYAIDKTFYRTSTESFGTNPDTLHYRDTIVVGGLGANNGYLELHPFEMLFANFNYPLGFNFQYYYLPMDNRLALETVSDLLVMGSGCLETVFDNDSQTRYVDCLGQVNWWTVSLWYSCGESLVYFKKGNEEWGTPIPFEILTPVKETPNQLIQHSIFPNPASSTINIQLKNSVTSIKKWKLRSINGVLQKHAEGFHHKEVSFSVTDLAQGLYQLILEHEDGEVFHYPISVIK